MARDEEPDYAQYATRDLEDASRRINRALFPERAKRLDEELLKRGVPARASDWNATSSSPAFRKSPLSPVLITCLAAPWVFFFACGLILYAVAPGNASTVQTFGWIGVIVLAVVLPTVITKHDPPESGVGLLLAWVGFPIYVLLCGMGSMFIWLAVLLAMGHTPR